MSVQFWSDNDPHNLRQGFHARFIFETMNGTVLEKYPRYIDLGEKVQEEWEGTKEEDTHIVGGNYTSMFIVLSVNGALLAMRKY